MHVDTRINTFIYEVVHYRTCAKDVVRFEAGLVSSFFLPQAMSRMRGVAVGGALQPPVVSPGPVIGDQVSESSQSDSLVGREGGCSSWECGVILLSLPLSLSLSFSIQVWTLRCWMKKSRQS